MARLDSVMLSENAPDVVETVRYNHEECPAGTDTRRRLYITRKDDGVIVGYCHNCGSSGMAVHGRTHYRSPTPVTVNKKVGVVTMPTNLEFEPVLWPKEATDWVLKAGVPLTTVRAYGLAYDLDTRRVIIPKYNVDNELVMWQSRSVGLDLGPKYLTEIKKDAQVHDPLGTKGDVVVICEDMMSAIRLNMYTTYDAIPLFSSSVNITKLLTPLANYDRIVVWLDNDGAEVNRHRDQLKLQLRSLGKSVGVVYDQDDPKHYTYSNIISIVEAALLRRK